MVESVTCNHRDAGNIGSTSVPPRLECHENSLRGPQDPTHGTPGLQAAPCHYPSSQVGFIFPHCPLFHMYAIRLLPQICVSDMCHVRSGGWTGQHAQQQTSDQGRRAGILPSQTAATAGLKATPAANTWQHEDGTGDGLIWHVGNQGTPSLMSLESVEQGVSVRN